MKWPVLACFEALAPGQQQLGCKMMSGGLCGEPPRLCWASGVMLALQAAAAERAEITSRGFYSASAITCKGKSITLPSKAPLYAAVLRVHPAAGGCHVFAHGVQSRSRGGLTHFNPDRIARHLLDTSPSSWACFGDWNDCFCACVCVSHSLSSLWFATFHIHSFPKSFLSSGLSALLLVSRAACGLYLWAAEGGLLSADNQLTVHTEEWVVCHFMSQQHASEHEMTLHSLCSTVLFAMLPSRIQHEERRSANISDACVFTPFGRTSKSAIYWCKGLHRTHAPWERWHD